MAGRFSPLHHILRSSEHGTGYNISNRGCDDDGDGYVTSEPFAISLDPLKKS